MLKVPGFFRISSMIVIVMVLAISNSLSNDVIDNADVTTTVTDVVMVDVPEYEKAIEEALVSLYDASEALGHDEITVKLAERLGSLQVLPTCWNISGRLYYASNSYDKAREILNIYGNFAEGVEKDYGIKIPYLTGNEINRLLNKARQGDILALTTMCTLVVDYNNVVLTARNVERGNPSTYTPFYNSIAKLIIDVALIRYNLPYKIAYEAVGSIFIDTGLYTLVLKYGGYKALKAFMSLTHWEIRGNITNIIKNMSTKEIRGHSSKNHTNK